MFNLGPLELGIIAAVVLLIFGPKRIPELGRSLGRTIKEFRGVHRELENDGDERS